MNERLIDPNQLTTKTKERTKRKNLLTPLITEGKMSNTLETFVNHSVSVITADGRVIIGTLKGNLSKLGVNIEA